MADESRRSVESVWLPHYHKGEHTVVSNGYFAFALMISSVEQQLEEALRGFERLHVEGPIAFF